MRSHKRISGPWQKLPEWNLVEPHLMQYQLAQIPLPLVMVAGGYDSDPNSVAECRDIISTQEKAHNENRICWFVGVMGGGSHSVSATLQMQKSIG